MTVFYYSIYSFSACIFVILMNTSHQAILKLFEVFCIYTCIRSISSISFCFISWVISNILLVFASIVFPISDFTKFGLSNLGFWSCCNLFSYETSSLEYDFALFLLIISYSYKKLILINCYYGSSIGSLLSSAIVKSWASKRPDISSLICLSISITFLFFCSAPQTFPSTSQQQHQVDFYRLIE